MATLVIVLLLMGCGVLAIRSIRKDHKKGGCSCGCSSCSHGCSHTELYAAYKAGEKM